MDDQPNAFVITTFTVEQRGIYETVIKPTFEREGWSCRHADEQPGAGNIVRQIIEHIYTATLVVVDLTALSGNALYELGMAHALSNHVLMLFSGNPDDLPFDLRNYRYTPYKNTIVGASELQRAIIEVIRTLPDWGKQPTNPVWDFLPIEWRASLRDSTRLTQAEGNDLNSQKELLEVIRRRLDEMQAAIVSGGDEHTPLNQQIAMLQTMIHQLIHKHTDTDESLLTELRAQQALLRTIEQRLADQPGSIVDTTLLDRQIAELRNQIRDVMIKRDRAETYLRQVVYERDVMLAQIDQTTQKLEDNHIQISLTSPYDGATLVFVPAGLFVPGPPRTTEDERHQNERFVRAFYMDKYPVTNAQFDHFVRATDYVTLIERRNHEQGYDGPMWRMPCGPGSSIEDFQHHPVVWIYREDALAYAKWAGRRLPTRLEWERAARGIASQVWPWGNQWNPTHCNLRSDGTTPVDTYPGGVSPSGCWDMIGNVWEWTADNLPDGKLLLVGGSWVDTQAPQTYEVLRVPRDGAKSSIGFRCAMDVPSQ